MTSRVAAALLVVAVVSGTNTVATPGPSNSQQAAPSTRPASSRADTRMDWWREARFGMFIHWGLYAVPAGEYKGKRAKDIGEWIMSWANIPRAEYEQFAPQFNPVKFDAAEWVRIAKEPA